MMKDLGLRSKVLLAAVLAVTGCSAATTEDVGDDRGAASVADAKSIAASTNREHKALAYVSRVQEIANPDGLTLRLYVDEQPELEMNPVTNLWVGIYGADGVGVLVEPAKAGTLAKITKVEHIAPNGVRITGTSDRIEVIDGAPELTHGHLYRVDFNYAFEADGSVKPLVRYRDQDGRDEEMLGVRDGAMVANLLAAHVATKDGLKAKAFAATAVAPAGRWPFVNIGGDPAMNGSHVLLNLDPGLVLLEGTASHTFAVATFDLGLDVSHVDKLAFVGPDQLRIEGTEDAMNAEGEIASQRFAYSVQFTRSANGAPEKVVKLKRLAR